MQALPCREQINSNQSEFFRHLVVNFISTLFKFYVKSERNAF